MREGELAQLSGRAARGRPPCRRQVRGALDRALADEARASTPSSREARGGEAEARRPGRERCGGVARGREPRPQGQRRPSTARRRGSRRAARACSPRSSATTRASASWARASASSATSSGCAPCRPSAGASNASRPTSPRGSSRCASAGASGRRTSPKRRGKRKAEWVKARTEAAALGAKLEHLRGLAGADRRAQRARAGALRPTPGAAGSRTRAIPPARAAASATRRRATSAASAPSGWSRTGPISQGSLAEIAEVNRPPRALRRGRSRLPGDHRPRARPATPACGPSPRASAT